MKVIKTQLVKGDKLTAFTINGMAMTSKQMLIYEMENEKYIIYKLPRKRKLFQIQKNSIVLLFKGLPETLPFTADSDGNCFRGNACINLVSDSPIEEITKYIEDNNLIEMTENEKSHLLLFTEQQADNSSYNENATNFIYPEGVDSPLTYSMKNR